MSAMLLRDDASKPSGQVSFVREPSVEVLLAAQRASRRTENAEAGQKQVAGKFEDSCRYCSITVNFPGSRLLAFEP